MRKLSNHIKRLAAPNTWKQPRKKYQWSVKASPGPHAVYDSIPLLVIIRDVIHLADNSKEAKSIIVSGKVLVDGRIIKNYKFPVGFMDIISIPSANVYKRVLIDNNGILTLRDISKEDAGWKLVKVTSKFIGPDGKLTIGTHDGRTIVTEQKNIKRGDTLKISLPDQKIIDHHPLTKDTKVYVTGGAHIGTITEIENVEISRSYQENTVDTKDQFTTTVSNIFVLGRSANEIGGAP